MPVTLHKAGAVAAKAGLSRKTLHAYVQIGLVRECCRTVSGYRLYDDSVFETLKFIRKLRGSGYSLQAIRETFRLAEKTPAASAAGGGAGAGEGGPGGPGPRG